MKRIILTIINFVSIILIICSIGVLTFGAAEGSALEYVRQPDYVKSASYESKTNEMMTDVFDYVQLTDIFEKDGKLDLGLIIAQADIQGQNVSYSLDYLIQYARSMGYYFDSWNRLRNDGSRTISKEEDELNHQIIVQYRAYLPNYKQTSPTDGQMSLGTLAEEALTYLARYYAVKNEFDKSVTNFFFNVRYTTKGKEVVFTNDPDRKEEDIRSLPSFVYVDSNSLQVSTSFNNIPQNLIPLLQARNPFQSDNSQYYYSVGIDTDFPNDDILKNNAEVYNSRRISSISGLLMLSLSSIVAILSLVYLALKTGQSEDSTDKKIHLYKIDYCPTEIIISAFFIWGFVAEMVAPQFIESVENVIGFLDNWDFWASALSFLLKYMLFVPMLFSLIRNYKADRLWKSSLLKKICDLFGHYIFSAEKTTSKLFSYLLFVLPNLLAFAMIVFLFVRFYKMASLNALMLALAILLIILSIDFYAWHIATGLSHAVDEQVKSERLKADLITNVSHDLKTPLTSIISYVDLLKREEIDNPRVQEYIKVLDQKSTRLKTLTEDLVEASKASSGNVKIDFADINYNEIVEQALGEFEDKTHAAKLEVILNYPDHPVMISADGRHLWRVIENLLNNCCKYALRESRVYVDITEDEDSGTATCTIKNISSRPLNISPEELTERFVRGDVSRTTEGSGLGLSIAKSLTKLMNGELVISIDGDLYKASVVLKKAVKEANDTKD
ncbi:sensor histidine kinase [Oribacterium sp. FC2011]|uniref:sensor histidine kinase n=1 Tax=Oribacterium sp. FC2011 TaxID=1408311 RepID=UPI0005D16A7A|nr:HAMP domain-containing sensor histidine kinase [Oribacterium sp. FC2011]